MNRRQLGGIFLIGVALTAGLAGIQYAAYSGFRLPFVPFSIAEVIRDLTPGPLKTIGIEALAYAAKALLVGASVLIYVLLGGLLAVVYARVCERLPGSNLLRGLLVGAFSFILTLPLMLARAWQPSDYIVGPIGLFLLSLLWGLVLDQTIRGALSRPDIPRDVDAPMRTRREFLFQTAIGGAFVGLLSSIAGKIMEVGLTRNTSVVPSPTPDADGFLPARGTWSEITPTDRFYVIDIGVGGPPKLNRDTWKLKVGGMVDKPIEYTFENLTQTFKSSEPFAGTLICISNPVGGDLIGTAIWKGVRLVDVLNAAGIQDGAKDIIFRCADGYSDSLPVAAATDAETYLVYEMNGAPLPYEHGYPVRVYVPGRYGEKNPKWVTSIEVINYDYKGYWPQQGWSDEAVIRHTAIINTLPPGDNVFIVNGTTAEVGGVANGGGRGISKVEFRVDDGPWQPARLKKPLSKNAWVLWKAEFPAEKGKRYKLTVRATDGRSSLQDESINPPHPNGATGFHSRDIYPIPDDRPPTGTPTSVIMSATASPTVGRSSP